MHDIDAWEGVHTAPFGSLQPALAAPRLTGLWLTLPCLSCLPLLSAPTLRGHTQSLPLLRTPVAFCLSFIRGSAATPLSCDPHVSCSCSLSSPVGAPSGKGGTFGDSSSFPAAAPSLPPQNLAPLLFMIVRIFKCASESQKGKTDNRKKNHLLPTSFHKRLFGGSLGFPSGPDDWQSGGLCVVTVMLGP